MLNKALVSLVALPILALAGCGSPNAAEGNGPPPLLTGIVLQPESVSLQTAERQQFTVVGQYSDGTSGAISGNFTGGGGTITPNGLYTAGSVAGSFFVIGVEPGSGLADTAQVTVSVSSGGGLQVSLVYGTYVGGAAFEEAREPVVLPGGRLLFGARTFSTTMPTTAGALQGSYHGGPADSWLGILNSAGTGFEAATFFGGSGMERQPYGIAVTSNGDIVFTSGTDSGDIPTTPGAYRPTLNSPALGGYICRVTQSLTTIQWCTYTAGWPRGGLTLAANDDVFVVGRVMNGANFSTTPAAYQTSQRGIDDAFVMRLLSDGTSTPFRTRLGGGNTVEGEVATGAVVHNNTLMLTGISLSTDFPTTPGAPQSLGAGARDAFFARLSMDGTTLIASTLMGGSAGELTEHGMVVLNDGSIITAGETFSADLPGAIGGLGGSSDGFSAKLNATGLAFDFVRYLGGSGTDRVMSPVVDGQGRIYLVGQTTSTDFPVTQGALQATYSGGSADGVLVILSADGRTILYATYLGGSGYDLIRGVAVDAAGGVYLVGQTTSNDFPVTAGAYQTNSGGSEDAFAVKLSVN